MEIFELAYEEITDEQLKSALKEKYRHIARFCKIAKLDISEFNKMLTSRNLAKRSSYFNNVMSIANCTNDRPIKGEITEFQISKIRIAIYEKHKNVASFCKEYGYSRQWISKLFSGGIIKITPHIERLSKDLKIKL